MHILIINGPNLNKLGQRDPHIYGTETLTSIIDKLNHKAQELEVRLTFFQSNHEGRIIDFLQETADRSDGIIINPGALSHYGFSLYDALIDTAKPVVEVHLSDLTTRKETWRQTSIISPIAVKTIMGKKGSGYLEALEFLAGYIIHH